MVTSYSQYGEDLILSRFFAGQETGFFVEAGALDGIRLSTTYLLAQHGWKGLLFEPDRRFFPALFANRPESFCYPWALDDGWRDFVRFHESSAEGLSTFDPVRAEQLRLEGKTESIYLVRCCNLTEVLAVHWSRRIDLLCLDTEGTTHRALHGANISAWRPRLIIAECFTADERESIPWQMNNHGYHLAHVGEADNHFYVRDEADVERLKTAVAEAQRVP